jgi:hypothetical protein
MKIKQENAAWRATTLAKACERNFQEIIGAILLSQVESIRRVLWGKIAICSDL